MLTVKQAANYLGLTTNALQRRIKSGTGPTPYRLGNRMLFKKTDVIDYLVAQVLIAVRTPCSRRRSPGSGR